MDDSWGNGVGHRGTEDRVGLLINFWHPQVPREQWRALEVNNLGYDTC